ncbi:MAG: phage tail tape measure protein, partial [Candidatus Aminicenantes bacterium]|nr:phage tail tape measure protein [Candidatus Aminicenantes bacterium]
MKNKALSIILKMRDEASKKLKGVQAHFRRFSADIKKMGAAFARVGVVLAAAAAAAVLALKKIISTGIAYGLQLDKISKQTAMTAEEFAKLSYAASQEHASIESLTKVIPILSKYMEYARQGMETYSREFDKMGVSVANAQGELRSTYDVLLDMSEYYKTAENKTQALAIATTLLGRRGAELIPLLKLGKDGINALGNELEQLGGVITSETAAAMKELDDKIMQAKTGLQGISIQLTAFFLPALKELAGTVTKDIKGLVVWAEKLRDNKEALEEVKKAFTEGWQAAQDFVAFLIVGAGQAVDAWNELNLILTSIQIGWIKTQNALFQGLKWSSLGILGLSPLQKQREESKAVIKALEKINAELAGKAQRDWSEEIVEIMDKVKAAIAGVKEELGGAGGEGGENLPAIMDPETIANSKTAWGEFIGGITDGLDKSIKTFGTFKERVSQHTGSMVNNMKTMWGDFIYNGFIGELDSAKEAFENFGKSV